MKRLRSLINAPALILGAVLLGLAAAAGAYAAGSDSTITACVHKAGGTLYQAKRCDRGDRELAWNTVGPTGRRGATGTPGASGANGATGPAGPVGATGPVGPAGSSAAAGAPAGHSATQTADVALSLDTPATVLTETLPAGIWQVSADVGVTASENTESNSAGDSIDTYCELTNGTVTADQSSSAPLISDFGIYGAAQDLSLETAFSASTSTTVTLECDLSIAEYSSSATVTAGDANIDAVQLSSLN